MKCEMCSQKAEVEISWMASKRQESNVCESCASIVWDKLSKDFTGTEAFLTFTVEKL